jgi:GDPmannose 4,6-dehydratase
MTLTADGSPPTAPEPTGPPAPPAPLNRSAFITGITGQDGALLARLLIDKGYLVHGLIRRSSSFNTGRLDGLYEDPHTPHAHLQLHYGDLADGVTLTRLLTEIKPDEIYHLGAQSHVRVSFDIPEYTCDITGLGTLRLLEAVRATGLKPRIYIASSSEMFGNAPAPQNEDTPLLPASPYACAKVFAHHLAGNYRDAYGMWIARGILFNHEHGTRGETFVTRKVCRGAARIAQGLDQKLYLGNLDAQRDWGWAPEFVEGMWRMLQHDRPDDFVLATGETHTIRDLLDEAFACFDLDWHPYVEIDPRYFRPTEVNVLRGDASKARRLLGWTPTIDFKALVADLCGRERDALYVYDR